MKYRIKKDIKIPDWLAELWKECNCCVREYYYSAETELNSKDYWLTNMLNNYPEIKNAFIKCGYIEEIPEIETIEVNGKNYDKKKLLDRIKELEEIK